MEKTVATSLRLPEQMLAKLKHIAIDNRRSLNSQVLIILQRALDKMEALGDENKSA